MERTKNKPQSERQLAWKKRWYRFSRNYMSVSGLIIVAVVIIAAIFAQWITPYPEHAGAFTDYTNANMAPSASHIFGTDNIGRDIFTRVIFAFRNALKMAVIVLAISVPVGSVFGMIAGIRQGTWVDTVIMRFTDIFLSVPSMILALAIASILKPNMTNAMLAITVSWWPWYCRLAYGTARSISRENYVRYAELTGGSFAHIVFREILPNCISPILTKMTLDVGWVIMTGASLSYIGLGEQAPTPALGNMISAGIKYLPVQWWNTVFPAIGIIVIILGFNLLGDGVSDLLAVEEE